ncbi:ABC transporter substrate-binding protein [Piscinibacter sakaiensis]|uniref:ABC transporter substrate-binding protein n=1 Tax=Piscinibacter sakaiensis TaxID=1547922 RepID=UPI003AAD61BD
MLLLLLLPLIGMLPLRAAAAAEANGQQQHIAVIVARGDAGPAIDAVLAGMADYIELLNRRDGGINGVRLVWDDCGSVMEAPGEGPCAEQVTHDRVAIALPGGLSPALAERSRAERIPLLMPADASSLGVDGRADRYAFTLLAGPLRQAAARLQFIADREGGIDRLRGKRIAYLHAAQPSRHEVGELLERQAAEYGFALDQHSIVASVEAAAEVWQAIHRDAVDWVLLDTAGPATSAALRAAARVGFPADRIIGSAAAGDDEDIIAAGAAAIGYIAASPVPSGGNFLLLRDIRRHLPDAAANAPNRRDAGYLRGIAQALLVGEAIRLAQRRYGARPIDSEQLRWGLERLQLDDERLSRLGALEMLPPSATSCSDHDAGDAVKFQQWLGGRWNVVSDWVGGDTAAVEAVIDTLARRRTRDGEPTAGNCPPE